MLMVDKAKLFASVAHASIGQLRKYTNEPYIVHPIEVASIVSMVTDDDEMIAAAYLHDVLEDTKVTRELLYDEFGTEVTQLVVWLTNISVTSDGNRKVRKQKDREHIANAPDRAQTIKIADLISNTSTIVKYDPKFAEVYLQEKMDLLHVLRTGDRHLWNEAYNLCVGAKLQLIK